MHLDYESLRVIWWLLLGVLLIGFAVMDGFDLGVAMWLPCLGRSDIEKRICINSIGPTWEGNQVWFILGGGAIFAAWPMLYAVSFSGFYLAMLLVLLALILRPVGFKYRSKLSNPMWRSSWDIALFIGGFVPALTFGVAIGNVLQGVPFYFDEDLRSFYTGTLFELFNPFGLFCGMVSVAMLAMHGAYFLAVKTIQPLQARAISAGRISAFMTSGLFVLGGIWLYNGVEGYSVVQAMPHDGPSNPMYKSVIREAHAWFNNYQVFPWACVVPIVGMVFSFLAGLFAKSVRVAFVCSGVSIAGIIATVGISMFPFILPSSSFPAQSLMVWDSSSSELTLWIMLCATILFLPIVLSYTAWVYRVLRGKVTEQSIADNQDTAY